ncbi:D-glycero-beta-D-manno-heptose 1-phosphate adenylyltransferase [Umezawaea beigongshangensis]|uniref:D-glycero-beta-D-manno-heptose 1-phosphate adenylyltransferase n=1 Tax=Umezawaea beigongshangensis TaxID=2780383 RepID=UPI0018F128C2|nr:D-glycero-beta-D-manno-heptose 1-phosphate adenylyltransferase [Umezawaea beigongshangensis]
MRLVVVGDALLDVDVEGTVERVCPDAPVPVLDVDREHVRPGGAGLAAALAAADGVDVVLVAPLADDADGARLREALDGVPAVFGRSAAPTTVKTRLRSSGRSIARIDRSGGGEPPVLTGDALDAVRSADAVLVADYGRGTAADPRLRDLLGALARHVPVVWDPHPRGPRPVPCARLVTPNLSEALAACRVRDTDQQTVEHVAARLRTAWRARAVAVTLGAGGALLHQGGAPIAVPAPPVTVLDPCGAGDRFAVTAAVRLMRGDTADEAVTAAVTAAGEFLERGGASGFSAGPAAAAEPRGTSAFDVVARTRARGGTVVATGGCFDLLHAGHARTLAAARSLGDCLVVCLNSDASVRRLKGEERPLNGQRERAEVLAALSSVDAVVVFDEDTPEEVLRGLRPDVWVKGGDYSADALPEAAVVRGWGGRTVVVPYHPGRSTTRLVTARHRTS